MNDSTNQEFAAPEAEEQATVQLSSSSFWLVYAALLIAMLLGALDQTIFSTALPTIVGELHGLEHMAWVTTAYILAATVVMPIYGKLGDLLGRRNVYVVAIALFTIGSAIAALAHSMGWLIIGRATQGLGGGGLMILAQAILADLVPARKRGTYMAPIGAMFGLASIIGPILGGYFTDELSWRWALWMNVPLGALAVGIALYALKLPKPSGRVVVDFVGAALLVVATSCTVLVATWGGSQYDWDSPTIIGLVIAALITWIAFWINESKTEEPLIPPHLFANRTFVITTLVGLLTIGIGMFALIGYLPTYFQMVYGKSATESGLLLLPLIGGLITSALISGIIMSKTGKLRIFPVIGTAVAGIGVWAISTINVNTELISLCSYLAIAGLGIGLLIQTLVVAAQNSFPAKEVGTVTSSNNFFREIGATLGTAIVGSVFATRLADNLRESVASGALSGVSDTHSITPKLVASLPEQVRTSVVDAYVDALIPIFSWILPVFVISFALTLFMKEQHLASGDETDEEEQVAVPAAI